MKNFYLCLLLCVACAIPTFAAPGADSVATAEKPKLKLAPSARALIDGGVFISQHKDEFHDGMAIADVAIGITGRFARWTGRIDIGYAGGKVGLRDIYIQYDLSDRNMLRVGNFFQQYGYQTSTSPSKRPMFESTVSNTLFNNSRMLGLMFEHYGPQYLGTLSLHAEPNALTSTPNETNSQGFGILTRQVWHPLLADDGTMLQVGISGGYVSPQSGGKDAPHDCITMSADFPTRVNHVVAQQVKLTNTRCMLKFTPELMAAYGPVALEAQYYYNRVLMRDDLHPFTGQGVSANVRTLLLGGHYTYSMIDGGIAMPRPGSLELLVLYDYATLSDRYAQYTTTDGATATGIFGGRTSTVSATLSYHINKYFLARLNYALTHRWDASSLTGFNADTYCGILQARIMFLF